MVKVSDALHVDNQPDSPAPATADQDHRGQVGRMLLRLGANEFRVHWVLDNVVICSADILLVDPAAADVVGQDFRVVLGQMRQEMSGLIRAPADALNDLPGIRPRG